MKTEIKVAAEAFEAELVRLMAEYGLTWPELGNAERAGKHAADLLVRERRNKGQVE